MSLQVESKPNSLLEAALLSEAPKQWERFQKSKVKRAKGKPKWQRAIEEIDVKVADAMADANESRELMRINANLKRKIGMPTKGLRCPKCGEGNMGNTVNGKHWCVKCNSPLEPVETGGKRLPKVKVLPKTKRLDVTFRGLNE